MGHDQQGQGVLLLQAIAGSSFLQQLLGDFAGVLVSDFYTAYDSLKCAQQKCLVHLVRDMDDDLLKNPLDMELKGMAQQFGSLLRAVIETVDSRGLKSRCLHKHKPAVTRFLDSVVSIDTSSPVASKYKKRFEKSGEKMFTFLGSYPKSVIEVDVSFMQ